MLRPVIAEGATTDGRVHVKCEISCPRLLLYESRLQPP